jgi:hypothetical protein
MKRHTLLALALLASGLAAISQNVGIGTTTPQERLHLVGRLRSDGVRINGDNTLELGFGVAGKTSNAGQIGYQTFSTGLDIVGAGSSMGTRSIKFWAEGGSTFAGSIRLEGSGSSSGLFLGVGVIGKETNAGRIGYSLFTPNTLDIVGAGTNSGNRRIKLWAEGGTELAGNAEIAGFTRLGTLAAGAPAIKIKRLTGTFTSGFNYSTVEHGLNANKILFVSVLGETSQGSQDLVPPNYINPHEPGRQFIFRIRPNDIYVQTLGTNESSAIAGRPYRIMIVYEE